MMELPRWLNIICLDMVIPIFGYAVRLNPWYVDFISGQALVIINFDLNGWLSSFVNLLGVDWFY